jgi:SAM-dependent methyltransferase
VTHLSGRLLGWLFERLYAELAWAYDPVSWAVSGGRWPHWRRVALRYVRGPAVLDVGCGTGALLSDLRASGYPAIGLEASAAMRRQTAARLRREGRPAVLVGGDARALPFGPASFDSLVWTFPTPVVHSSAWWQEAARVLRPGGRVVVVLGAESQTRIWPGLLERLLDRVAGVRSAALVEDRTDADGIPPRARVTAGPPTAPAASWSKLPERSPVPPKRGLTDGRLALTEVVVTTRHGRVRLLLAEATAEGSPPHPTPSIAQHPEVG